METLGEGLRLGLLLGAVALDSIPDGPGLIVLDEDYRITDTTPNAERWLAELDQGPCGAEPADRNDLGGLVGGQRHAPRDRDRSQAGAIRSAVRAPDLVARSATTLSPY